MEKLHTFKSFSQVREEAAKMKQLKEVSNKQAQSIEKYNSLLKEYGIASPNELEEELRNQFFSKLVESIDSSFAINEGTRGQIGVLDKSGKITTTYVHYGSVSMAGDFLRNNGGKEAKELLKLGKAGISFLGKKITAKNDFNNPDNDAACFYGRDRGEKGNAIATGKVDNLRKFVNDIKNDGGAEYLYLWDETTGKWLFMDTYEDETLQVFESNTSFDLNEAISRSAISRMNGLVLIKEMKQLLDVAGVLIQDLVETEGFEFDECVDYLGFRIADEWNGVYEGKTIKASEGNAFGAAVTKAKEDEKDEFEFKGKTFKVTEAEEILEARSINKIQNDWTKVTGEMAELAKEWKAAEGDAKTALLAKMKAKTADKKALEKELDAAVAGKDKDLELAVESVNVNEGFEVHYSDGVRAMKKFNNQKQAMDFAKELIKNKKGLQFVDVFNAGSGFHSTADTDAIVAFWGEGSYTDNVSKKDSKLAAKKMNESIDLKEAEINSEEEFTEYAHEVLKKAFGEEYDETKAKATIDGILSKADGDFGAAIGMLTSGLGESVANEALKATKPNEVVTVDVDMAWDDSDKEEDKAAKAAFKKYKITVKGANGQPGTYEMTGKKKDILAYLQSEFYEMDDETVEEYYPELLEGNSFEICTITKD